MLLNLHVVNLALIDELQVDFGEGLNILTGETGAGKSIIIGSIGLALGGKAKGNVVRQGADAALIELIFSLSEDQEKSLLDMGIDAGDGELIMSRRILASGRSVCRINSETVPAARLKRAASLLIDIYGQREHQALLARKNHLKYVDSFAGDELIRVKEKMAASFAGYEKIRDKLDEMKMDEAERARELDFLEFEARQIREAHLKIGEDEELEALYRKLLNGKRIADAACECRELCSDNRESASECISRGLRCLMPVTQYDEQIDVLCGQLQEVESLLSDFNRELAVYISDIDMSEETLMETESRLDLINSLKAKYAGTIEQILKELDKKEERIEFLNNYGERIGELEKELRQCEEELEELAGEISGIRKKYASVLTEQIQKALKDLNFEDVRFEAEFSELDHFTSSGTDEMRFMISLNPGGPLMPLEDAASGGELSRIMLALKTVLAESDDIETLIFDEIDTGISGRTAQKVAEKIKLTGKDHQVVCITHLPQIAAMADEHFLIEKTSDETSTVSKIRRLDYGESVDELARMLGGVKITDAVLENAREMKALAETI